MPADPANHAAYVQAWLDGEAKNPGGLTTAQLISLFERGMSALWQRAQVTLGDVTLGAIVDRVLNTATERFPSASTLKLEAAGVRFDEFRAAGAEQDGELSESGRFVLVEFLTVISNLTDDILTPALHAALARVALEEAPQPEGSEDGGKGARS